MVAKMVAIIAGLNRQCPKHSYRPPWPITEKGWFADARRRKSDETLIFGRKSFKTRVGNQSAAVPQIQSFTAQRRPIIPLPRPAAVRLGIAASQTSFSSGVTARRVECQLGRQVLHLLNGLDLICFAAGKNQSRARFSIGRLPGLSAHDLRT